jgi:hypothetical protein
MELMTMAQVEWRKWIRSHTEPKTMTSFRCTRWYQKAQDDIFDFLYILFLFLSTITSQYKDREKDSKVNQDFKVQFDKN